MNGEIVKTGFQRPDFSALTREQALVQLVERLNDRSETGLIPDSLARQKPQFAEFAKVAARITGKASFDHNETARTGRDSYATDGDWLLTTGGGEITISFPENRLPQGEYTRLVYVLYFYGRPKLTASRVRRETPDRFETLDPDYARAKLHDFANPDESANRRTVGTAL